MEKIIFQDFIKKIQGRAKRPDSFGPPGIKGSGQKVYGYTITKKRLRGLLHELNPYETKLFIALKVYENKWGFAWPGERTLAKDVNMDKNTISRNALSLQTKGFIKIEAHQGKHYKRYVYQLLK